jgi:hypothetical protein
MATSTTTVGAASDAENRAVEIEGATLVYRRFGDDGSDAPPLLFEHAPVRVPRGGRRRGPLDALVELVSLCVQVFGPVGKIPNLARGV